MKVKVAVRDAKINNLETVTKDLKLELEQMNKELAKGFILNPLQLHQKSLLLSQPNPKSVAKSLLLTLFAKALKIFG